MKNIAAIVGWILLAVILAVPAFLFYNWWMNKQAAKAREMPQAADMNVFKDSAEEDLPFEGSEEQITAGNAASPVSEKSAVPAAGKPEDSVPAAEGPSEKSAGREVKNSAEDKLLPAAAVKSSTVSVSRPVSSITLKTTAAAGVPNAASPAKENKTPPASVKGNVCEKSHFNPKTDRNPVLSPKEYAKIKYELERRKELEKQRRLAELRRKKEQNKAPKLNFQGIIGKNVIINGEMYKVGDSVKGVKILRIGYNYFLGYYRGKKFKVYLK